MNRAPFHQTEIRKTLRWLLYLGTISLIVPTAAQAIPEPVHVRFYKNSPLPQAVVLSVKGECRSSADGEKFKKLRVGEVLHEGAVIRTGGDGRVDLFVRRLAITIRVTSNTDLALLKMAKHMKEDVLMVETILDLRAGQIYCFVRGLTPNSRFEVKHKAGRSVVEGEGVGGYEIGDDFAAVTSRVSFIPLKVISDNGVAVVAPGHKFDAKHGKNLKLAPTEEEETLMQLDELQALADLLSPEEDPAE